MRFDARTAKALKSGQHITFSEYPGLRLLASATVRTWTYRYKKSSRWSNAGGYDWSLASNFFPAAIVAWEGLKNQRDSGVDPVLSKKQEKIAVQASIEKQKSEKAESAYSVRVLCDEYLAGHVYRHRAKKGATEITRMFVTIQTPTVFRPSRFLKPGRSWRNNIFFNRMI